MGPGPKGREEQVIRSESRRIVAASMGPGPKGREERPKHRSAVPSVVHASMGPGPKGREERVQELEGTVARMASMGPGPKGREEPRVSSGLRALACASMGPGPKGREEPAGSETNAAPLPSLQWGPALKAGRNLVQRGTRREKGRGFNGARP